MGAADVVPGVSGGTIAFISGIYQELIFSINQVNLKSIQIFKNQGFIAFFKYINGYFLLSLLSGIGISIISLAKVVSWLMDQYPVMLWSFFFGLVLASVYYLSKELKGLWNIANIICFLVGFAIAIAIALLPISSPETSYLFIFLCGSVSICAMILPGISGAFILLLLGAYQTILQAVTSLNLKVLFTFGSGAIVGLLSFSRVLKWLFSHYKVATTATLTGFIAGSLYKIWPWKQTVSYYIDRYGVQKPLIEKNIIPSFSDSYEISIAFFWICLGFFLIFTLEILSNRLKKLR